MSPVMPTNATEVLWHAAVCKDNSTICSGSLINDNYIVTTANCVCNDNTVFTKSVSVQLNKNYGCSVEESDAVQIDVTKITCHPMYNPETFENNIALLKLATTLDTTKFEPICLPTDRDTSSYDVNTFAGIYGFGQFNTPSSADDHEMSSSTDGSGISTNDDYFNELLFEVTKIVPINECNIAYGYSVSVTNDMTCTSELSVQNYF